MPFEIGKIAMKINLIQDYPKQLVGKCTKLVLTKNQKK
ncbi:hypothetical protein OE09_2480 [Flavobacteriaceae bacterium MAR_2010_72]|nr:hypothetical protein OE09_2480 [Flavobacteriaceae bacterium MAR_2010_72]